MLFFLMDDPVAPGGEALFAFTAGFYEVNELGGVQEEGFEWGRDVGGGGVTGSGGGGWGWRGGGGGGGGSERITRRMAGFAGFVAWGRMGGI